MRYFIGFLITIGLLFLLIILLAGGGGGKKVPKTSKPLASYSTTAAITQMTVDGPVNSNQEHEKIRISVSQDKVIYDRINGYDNKVIDHKEFVNTEEAYASFLKSLQYYGFTQGNTTKALADERGHCPEGNRYVFELIDNGDDLQRFWTTSCGKPKTYLGLQTQTINLFTAQVPGIDNFETNISIL
jgi:hypothetical protein